MEGMVMEPTAVGLIGLGIMVALILAGVHIGVAMAVTGFGGVVVIIGWDAALGILGSVPYTTISNYSLSIIIMFVLMGQLLTTSGLTDDLFNFANTWLGHLTGGMAMSTALASALVGALCGATTATTATMGIVALPAMKKYHYDGGLAAATVACAATLSIMVPPSIMIMMYGVITSLSIGKLFIAVIIPGILLTICFMLAIYLKIKLNPELAPAGQRYSWKDRLIATYKVKDTLFVIVLVIGGILTGLFTVNEAGAIGVIGIMISAALRRKLNYFTFKTALLDTGKVSAMVFMIMIGAMILGYFFAITQLPTTLATFFANLPVNRYFVLLGIIAVYIFLGALMDEMAMLLLTVPIFYPVILGLGFDPIWFGVMICLIMASGLICPPVGMNCFIVAGLDKSIPLHKIYQGIVPFWLAIVFMMVLITVFPEICTSLPDLVYR
jgi:tripartite ATP-independent transporter DctM subunit